MPYYRITITNIYGKVSQWIRFDHFTDVEAYYQKVHKKALLALKNTIKSIDLVMHCDNTVEVRKYLQKKGHRPAWGPEIYGTSSKRGNVVRHTTL